MLIYINNSYSSCCLFFQIILKKVLNYRYKRNILKIDVLVLIINDVYDFNIMYLTLTRKIYCKYK